MSTIANPQTRTYARPDALVGTDWAKEHLGKPGVRFVEVDVDTKAYDAGHIPGAVGFNWQTQLQDQLRRDIISKQAFEELVGGAGISNDDVVVLYGDNNNWFAAYGFWLFKLYGHRDVRLINGGRVKWLNEADKPLTVDRTTVTPVQLPRQRARSGPARVRARGARRRAHRGDRTWWTCAAPMSSPARSSRRPACPKRRSAPATFRVRRACRGAPPSVRMAASRPPTICTRSTWSSRASIRRTPTIAYCRIGERSSHTWFVLRYLLGFEHVTNYDGSWTEYGNLIGVPIER